MKKCSYEHVNAAPFALPPTNGKIVELRKLLEEKFPQSSAPKVRSLATGLAALDDQEALRLGALTEVRGTLSGASLLLASFLGVLEREKSYGALIDRGSFDPGSFSALSRLLWVRCGSAMELLKATDLLLRDGNLPLVIADLRRANVPPQTWRRFHRLVEQKSTALVVLASHPVEGASVRIFVEGVYHLDALVRERTDLLATLKTRVELRRGVLEPLLRSA